MNRFARNAVTLLTTPSMVPWWLRWHARKFGVPCELEIPGGGHINAFRSFNDLWSIRNMGPSEAEYQLIRRVVTPESVNFDVGANVGVFTLAIAKTCLSANVYSFEPTPVTFERLQQNVELNRLANVRLRQVAMGSQPNRALLQLDPHSPALNRLTSSGNPSQRCIEVDVQTIDANLRQTEDRDLGLLKIDVEGFECDVLMGAADSIRGNRWAAVLIEFCPANLRQVGRSVADLVAICESLGCSLFELTATGNQGKNLTNSDLESIEWMNALVAPGVTQRRFHGAAK